jgi:DNA adenine methylase
MPTTHTPLRYPGGKTKLTKYVSEIIKINSLFDCNYIEPYAGGAGLAISLLVKGFVRYLHLNDIDVSIYAFWHSVLNEADNLCSYIKTVNINIDEWEKQKEIQNNKQNMDLLSLGKSTFFLNRTNRSGILNGGIIGGRDQTGNYKIDARFNKEALIKKIKLIEFYKSRITIHNQDAIQFLEKYSDAFPENSIINLDPPYYEKGQQLYQNAYDHSDHQKISQIIPGLKPYWIMTYDNAIPIKKLYFQFPVVEFSLSYTAQKRYQGKEILIADPRLELPFSELLKVG